MKLGVWKWRNKLFLTGLSNSPMVAVSVAEEDSADPPVLDKLLLKKNGSL